MAINEDKPEIIQVLDERGRVPREGVTRDVDVVVSGTSGSNVSLNLYDNLNYVDFVHTQEGGEWTMRLDGLSMGMHSLTASQSSADLMSAEYRFFVVDAIGNRPEITLVRDSSGGIIPDGGFTQDTFVTLQGTSEDVIVEILDQTTSWGTARIEQNNAWHKPLAGLEAGLHAFIARNMSDHAESLPRSFTVVSVETSPDISRVRDSEGTDITNGGFTEDTSVTLSGTAEPNIRVEVLDDNISWGTAQVSISGTWTKPLAGLALGNHRFRARSMSSQLESIPWEFTVREDDPLVIDTSPMHLDGFTIWMSGGVRTGNESPGNTERRQPTGGVGPYTYSTSDFTTAEVDSSGKVRGRGWGEAIISVTDQESSVVTFSVIVTNVYMPAHSPYAHPHSEAMQVLESAGSRYKAFDQHAYDELVRVYQRPFVDLENYWCPVVDGCGNGLALIFRYPEQELGCADPNLEYQVLMIRQKGTLPYEPEIVLFGLEQR